MNLQKNTMTMEQLLEQLIKKVSYRFSYREREAKPYRILFVYKVRGQLPTDNKGGGRFKVVLKIRKGVSFKA